MRAGPLSSPEIISLLNSYFVPVFYSRKDRLAMGTESEEERAEIHRVFREGREAKLSVGVVHAYILTPEGRVVDSLHVAQAAKLDQCLAMLTRNIEKLNAQPGETIVSPRCQSAPPPPQPDSLVLHLVSRNILRSGQNHFPAEDWIVLAAPDAAQLLPPAGADAGTAWTIDPELAARILVHVYPTTENTSVAPENLEQHALTGRIVSLADGTARARLEGSMRMKHNGISLSREDGRFVEAELIGYLDYDTNTRRIQTLRLMTSTARYGNEERVGTFGATVESVSNPAGIR